MADEEMEYEVDCEGDRVINTLRESARRKRGRGLTDTTVKDRLHDRVPYVDDDEDFGPQRSVEGWILFVTSVHEEAQEEDIHDKFAEYGAIKNLHLNLDRRTGFLKGYAVVEYESYKEAVAAKEALNGSDILGQTINVDWGFVKTARKVRSGGRTRKKMNS